MSFAEHIWRLNGDWHHFGKEFISSLHFNLFQLMCYDEKKNILSHLNY